MKSRDGSNYHVVLVAALLVVLPLGAYFGAYFGLTTDTSRDTISGVTHRVFRNSWQAIMFVPATLVESALTGCEVAPAWTDPDR
jgi:hypothetical protein